MGKGGERGGKVYTIRNGFSEVGGMRVRCEGLENR